jgi:myo-inositol-1-phosphate synthase
MNERQVRKVQKNRHMTEIQLNIASNSVFKNLSARDRMKLAKIIYKAEMVEFYVREKDLNRVNSAFQEMIANALMNIDAREFPEDLDDDDDDPFKKFD